MEKAIEMLAMWQFWSALFFMFVLWRFIKYLAGIQRVAILRVLALKLWSWQRKILHAALVVQYAADVSEQIKVHDLTARAESMAKQTIIMSVDPILLDESEKIPSRS